MTLKYNDNLLELLTEKRVAKCFPNKVQRFKPPLVAPSDFPSRVTLNSEYGLEEEEEMSDSDVKSETSEKAPITSWRRAEPSDVQAVESLIAKSNYVMNDLFGEPDVPNLIEKSNFSIVQLNSGGKIISFSTAFSYPDIPAVPSFQWYEWLDNLYSIQGATPRNCFFIHYMIWDKEYYNEFFRLTLETMFLENTFLTYIIITKPPKVKIPSIIPESFIQMLPKEADFYNCDYNSLQTVLLCLRHSLLSRFKIRLAIVEDHDDLMPVAEQHTERLRELYGDYCMAEIIQYPGTKDRKTLVFESMGYAVAFMNINRSIDFDLLNTQFDLGVFHGLKKPSETDMVANVKLQEAQETDLYLPERINPLLETITSETMMLFLNWKPSLNVCEEDLSQSSALSESSPRRYNEISGSMSDIIRETLNVKLVPKFSAHALTSYSSSSCSTESSETLLHTDPGTPESSLAEDESKIQTESSLISLQHFNLPVFNGEPNAFCIEFYAVNENFDSRVCHQFLEAAFEAFPDLDYCVLTIPSQAPVFPLLDLFTRVAPRPLKRFRQELYICHKSSIVISFMRVRRLRKGDLDEINVLLRGIRNRETIYADVASSCFFGDSSNQGFVLVCSKSIVGVAVLCNEAGMEYLAHHYHVSELIDFELHKIEYHAILKHLVLSPIYQAHARFFLRDIMRMADVTSLYRARYEEAEAFHFHTASLITVLGHLTPVKPRRMVQYHRPSLHGNIPPEYFLKKSEPFSLYHINSRICGLNKIASNINLVIIGSSRTALSFLEALLFDPSAAYVTYNNITLVSPHGIGTELPSHYARDLIFPGKGKMNRFYKIQMCFKAYVNFVYGVMTHINRVEKYITINNDAILPYDYLILLCGRQYILPVPIAYMTDDKLCRRNFRPRCTLFKYLTKPTTKPLAKGPSEHRVQEPNKMVYPPNVFLINTQVDATNAFISLQYLIRKRKNFPEDEKIIIYGHRINVYLCVQSLLKYGVPPNVLTVVEPFPIGIRSVSCFKDENIDAAVIKSLKDLNIDHFKGFSLYEWNLTDNNEVCSVTFHSERRKITIKCLAMFPYDRKSVSDVTFKAVNEASLVYDGKLVINNCFRTNDPYIYAAGGLTKYQRKYYAKDKSHTRYDSYEVGKNLAEIIRKKVDPTEDPEPEIETHLVPHMTQPLVMSAILPGDWSYLCIMRPGKFEDPETRATIKEFGDVLITGDCEMTNGYGYFKIMLDECGFVEAIFCYTKDEIDKNNLEMLYGKHQKLLNDLLLRFDLGMIKDFYSYFREPWAYAIYDDQFCNVIDKNYEAFYAEKLSGKDQKIIDMIVGALRDNNWQRLPQDVMNKIKRRFETSQLRTQITNNILEFLYYFDEPFPMYATPRILRVLLHDASTSLLHKNVVNPNDTTKTAIRIYEMTRKSN